MATYLQGVTDYIPQIQEFKPDFNFYAKSLQMSQGKYDANHDKLSSLYGSLLNSPMLREKNIEERDAFFKTIDQDIKRMSGMDLSKQQNVDSASSIFNQMLDNKSIVKDMVWTKNWQKEHQRADGFRNCVDPEKCGGAWWEGGVSALNYRADEFKNATEEEAMSFGNAKYTPYQDVMGKAVKLAKEADLNITMDQKSGGYIVTTKNGPNLLAKPLSSLFMGTLGKDPAIMDYFKTKAYVDRKGWISSKIPEYGSREAAQQAYIQEMTQATQPELQKAEQDITDATENVSNQRKALENEIRTKGTTANSTLAEMYRAAVGTEQQLGASGEVIKEANGNLKVGLNNAGTRAALANLDAALAAQYLQDDIGNAAMTLAYKDYSQTMEADPFAMENVKQANRIALSGLNYKESIALQEHQFDLDMLGKSMEAKGDASAMEGWKVTPGAGGVEANAENTTGTFDTMKQDLDSAKSAISANEKQMLTAAFVTIQQQAKNADKTQSAGAQADLIALGDAMLTRTKKDDAAFSRKYEKMTDGEKISFLKGYDFTSDIAEMDDVITDALYDNALHPMINMNDKSNTVNRKYLGDLWSAPANVQKRTQIQRKSIILEQLNKGYKENVAKVKKDIQALDSEFSKYAPAIEAYIDENGLPKSEKQFVHDYMEQTKDRLPDVQYKVAWSGEMVNEPRDGTGYTKTDEQGNPIAYPTDKRAITKQAYFEAEELWKNMSEEDGLTQKWREAYSKRAVVKGQTNTVGGGSEAVAEARAYLADGVQFQSTATTGFMGTARDVFSNGIDNARVVLGGMSDRLPEESDELASTILQQLYSDMATRSNPKDKSRPILQVTTQNIGGGNSDWMVVNVKADDTYTSQYTGSKSNKGLLYEHRLALQNEGLSMYVKKSEATNQFYENSKHSDIETVIKHNGQYDIDDFPGYFDGTLKKMSNGGGYILEGMMLTDIDKAGNPIETPVVNDYWSSDTDPNQIMESFRQQLLYPTVTGVKQDQAAYNRREGIRDPQSLLQ